MTFRPLSPQRGAFPCLGIAAVLASLALWSAQSLNGLPASARLFWQGLFTAICFGGAIYFSYLAYAFWRLTYHLDRNGLQIRWGGVTRRIPIGHISEIAPAVEVSLPAKHWLGLRLPAWWVGAWQGVAFYSTAAPEQALVVRTAQGEVVISPVDPQTFIRAWRLRLPLGPTQRWTAEVSRWPLFNLPFWFDPLARRLGGGGVLIFLIVLGASLTAYPTWPPAIPIRANAFGQIVALASREQFLWLPVVGGMLLFFNLALGAVWYKRERLAAYLIWAMALLVQLGIWIALRAAFR